MQSTVVSEEKNINEIHINYTSEGIMLFARRRGNLVYHNFLMLPSDTLNERHAKQKISEFELGCLEDLKLLGIESARIIKADSRGLYSVNVSVRQPRERSYRR